MYLPILDLHQTLFSFIHIKTVEVNFRLVESEPRKIRSSKKSKMSCQYIDRITISPSEINAILYRIHLGNTWVSGEEGMKLNV